MKRNPKTEIYRAAEDNGGEDCFNIEKRQLIWLSNKG
jgi:hypothetical protein